MLDLENLHVDDNGMKLVPILTVIISDHMTVSILNVLLFGW